MKKLKFPSKLINIVQDHIKDRTFRVKIKDNMSNEQNIRAEVPQGSVLGPLLYNIYTSDIPNLKARKIAQFPDDTAIFVSSRRNETIIRKLQTAKIKETPTANVENKN